jgi:hypothetical protein
MGGMNTMTRDEILTMPAGRSMDVLVAELVLGWRKIHPDDDDWVGMPPGVKWAQDVSHHSTDIVAAWAVHRAMCERLFSERRRYLDCLTEVVRTRVKASVAWPDVLVFIEPTDFCRAALLAGVAEPAAAG